ncbi:MAG: hypothetical protein ACE5GA_02380 [Candidatus Zixiibacteriota bacterium]
MNWSMDKHITVLGVLFIVHSALGLFAGAVVCAALFLGGAFVPEPDTSSILVVMGVRAALVVAAISVPGLIAGFGLLRYRSWSRMLTIVLAVIQMINVPFGTALAIYGLWVLMQDEAIRMFESPPGR